MYRQIVTLAIIFWIFGEIFFVSSPHQALLGLHEGWKPQVRAFFCSPLGQQKPNCSQGGHGHHKAVKELLAHVASPASPHQGTSDYRWEEE